MRILQVSLIATIITPSPLLAKGLQDIITKSPQVSQDSSEISNEEDLPKKDPPPKADSKKEADHVISSSTQPVNQDNLALHTALSFSELSGSSGSWYGGASSSFALEVPIAKIADRASLLIAASYDTVDVIVTTDNNESSGNIETFLLGAGIDWLVRSNLRSSAIVSSGYQQSASHSYVTTSTKNILRTFGLASSVGLRANWRISEKLWLGPRVNYILSSVNVGQLGVELSLKL